MTETALFSALELDTRLERAVTEMGFDMATPVQTQAIPLIRTGVDVIARSQTGTGKTVAFAIPALERIDAKEERPTVQVLILCPTRELAQQAGDEVEKLARFLPGVRPVEVYGGTDMRRQFIRLRRANLVIGTPGRVMDHMRRGSLKLDHLKMIVLDEADEMLKMGFKEDIETILQDTPEERQTVLFSATMPPAILALTKQFQRDPQMIEINKSQVTIENIDQRLVEVPALKKKEALHLLLRYHRPNRALIFCNTKHMVDELKEYLDQNGHSTESIHGDLKQSQRTMVMNSFKQGRVSILIATDVAARGIDVSDIDYVINYDIPMKTEEYVHRIGRTGRAGKSGCAITLCCGRRQLAAVRNIAREVKSEIKAEPLPSIKDLRAKARARDLEEMRTALTEDAGEYLSMVETLVAEGYGAEQIAAAALMKLFPAEEVEQVALPVPHPAGGRPDGLRPAARGGRTALAYADIVIDVGSSNRVTPNHLVGAITEQSGISGRMIGKIDIYPEQSVVGIPVDCVGQVLDAMQGCKICGKPTRTVRLAVVPAHRAREKSVRR